MVEITTRYLGVLTYAGLGAIALLQGLVHTVQEFAILAAPIALFVVADQVKHRNDL